MKSLAFGDPERGLEPCCIGTVLQRACPEDSQWKCGLFLRSVTHMKGFK